MEMRESSMDCMPSFVGAPSRKKRLPRSSQGSSTFSWVSVATIGTGAALLLWDANLVDPLISVGITALVLGVEALTPRRS